MPVNEIIESEYGAFVSLDLDFRQKVKIISDTDNYIVFEINNNRVVIAKTSRLAGDDKDGVYGMNLYRKLPTYEEANRYWKRLPNALNEKEYVSKLAFAAKDMNDYEIKKKVFQAFYEYIFEQKNSSIVFVAPHSGDIRYEPDSIKQNPKGDIDKWSAGVSALCGIKCRQKTDKRVICFIHTSSDQIKSFPAVIDIGDMDFQNEYTENIKHLNFKYSSKLDNYSNEYFDQVIAKTIRKLKSIYAKYNTFDFNKIIGETDSFHLKYMLMRLDQYGISTENLSVEKLDSLSFDSIKNKPGIILNYVFQGKNITALLNLKEKYAQGKFDYCVQFECSQYYLKNAPDLISDIIVDFVENLK
ncbi:MAG: hypothetical protein RBS89_03090 [Candidatus Delongbacteria bacterium]|jgi:hypothetical protein|nr:hypothetical protein [Candidatus Delongbacteria bacterium]